MSDVPDPDPGVVGAVVAGALLAPVVGAAADGSGVGSGPGWRNRYPSEP
jgi:hypothetical protein